MTTLQVEGKKQSSILKSDSFSKILTENWKEMTHSVSVRKGEILVAYQKR